MTKTRDYWTMAGRPSFDDRDHPLRTSDDDAQREVAERIRAARKAAGYANEDIGMLWLVTGQAAGDYLRNPGKMDRWQVRSLCDFLGVTLDHLRHGCTNLYFVYQDGDVAHRLYDLLSPTQKAAVYRTMCELAGRAADEKARGDAVEEDLLSSEFAGAKRLQDPDEFWHNLSRAMGRFGIRYPLDADDAGRRASPSWYSDNELSATGGNHLDGRTWDWRSHEERVVSEHLSIALRVYLALHPDEVEGSPEAGVSLDWHFDDGQADEG